ncbi:TPA: sigma-54-dependent Fis family transcriptional regulator [Candidatus Poribacteria bacterium]|nr:sigma-54-dependent Fis family transcriptional regulator [Candidatus Poribacteria bacterium]
MKPKKILIVDDDEAHRMMLKANLSKEGYQLSEAGDGLSAVQAVREDFFDLILMDIRMPQKSGIEALKEIKEISPSIPVLLITAYAELQTAIEAVKLGAEDYIQKPIDAEKLKVTVANLLTLNALKQENELLKERLGRTFSPSEIIGKSPKMQELYRNVAMIAPTDATVLIQGESGTGKELIADLIHQNSGRTDGAFVKVNCTVLPDTLLESELFGYERGAFTGAYQRKQGRFELADGGSIFLDEIGDMNPSVQAKLLRVLQEQKFERLGGTKTITVDVRIIAATNKDLEAEVKEGNFRDDLFYRLNVVPITVPPLRERKEDIPLLAEHFLKYYAEKNHRPVKGLLPRTLDLLMRYDWPGNVRELENAMERAVIIARAEQLTPADLPLNIQALADDLQTLETGVIPGRTIKEVERDLIIKTLEQTGGNRTHAAKTLGITRKTLQNKLKEYQID